MQRLSTLLSLLLVALTFDHHNHHGRRHGVEALKYNSIAQYYSAYRRRCVEKSLEARESSADAVFTGTIRDLIPDRRHSDLKVRMSFLSDR